MMEDGRVSRTEVDQFVSEATKTDCKNIWGLVAAHQAAQSLSANPVVFEPGVYDYFKDSWRRPGGIHTSLRQKVLSVLENDRAANRSVSSWALGIGLPVLLVGAVLIGCRHLRPGNVRLVVAGAILAPIGAASSLLGGVGKLSIMTRSANDILSSYGLSPEAIHEVLDPKTS